MKTKNIVGLILGGLMAVSTCACNVSDNSENTGSSGSSAEEVLPDKKLSNALFENPSLDDRPMVQMHSVANSLIDDVYNRGYGGIVTNVAWTNDYLNNARAFSSLTAGVRHAVDKGMHVWLYDEYGYPSGSAYGQTLKGNPEYEALGLVPTYTVVSAGSTGKATLLYGHKEIVSAYVYDGTSQSDMDLSSASDVSHLISSDKTSVSYSNRTSKSKVLVAYMSKRWYENTHSMENWYAQQRYINMLDEAPTQKFINVTHEKYYEYLGDYFGNGIQAFFTDEPAMQGNYFNISERNRQVLDVPDKNIPIVECLNYSEALFDNFQKAYGYDLKPYLGYLYNEDNSEKAKQVRIDFYLLTSQLFESNYFGAIESWCKEHNVKSSGHLLLEEALYQNPWFEGDMLQLLGEMGIPGSDLLFSEPLGAVNAACIVSKMAAAAAEYTGKKDTFAEISGAFDGTKGDIYDQINAVGVQFCMGVNTFSSYYYQGGDHTEEQDKIFSTALGRMRYMTTGVEHRSKVALYYPYEGVSAETLPTRNMWEPSPSAQEVSNSFNNICRTMVGKQVDYDLVDYINLGKCEVKDGNLVAPSGERYSAVVIPYTTAIYSTAVSKLLEAAKAGVKVVLTGIDEIVCETGNNNGKADFDELYKLAVYKSTENGSVKYLREQGYTYATLNDEYAENVFITKRENLNYSVFTVVNAYNVDKTYEISLEATGKTVKMYNPVEGTVETVSATKTGKGFKFNYKLPKNRTVFFVVEK